MAEVLPILSEREHSPSSRRGDERDFHWALSFGRLHRDQQDLAQQSAGWLINGKAIVQESLVNGHLARDKFQPRALAELIKKLLALRTDLASLSLPVLETRIRKPTIAENWPSYRDRNKNWPGRSIRPPAGQRKTVFGSSRLRSVQCMRPTPCWSISIRYRSYIVESKGDEKNVEPARYVAWIVPPIGKGNVEIVDLGTADEVDQTIETARRAIEQTAAKVKTADDEEQAERAALVPLTKLAALVLEPLKPHLKNAKQIVLSPDSNLWLVPWAALPVEEGKYAIEEWQIRYVTSGRDSAGRTARRPEHEG